ncbi:MAG: glycosyltransferase family 4 protein [Planctomycetes bacterium]|nr:glycosyltransferase family 4 protein [Planctomycetota bacterium]
MRIAVLTDSLADTDGVGRYTIRLMRAIEAAAPGTQVEVALARKHPGLSADVPSHWPIRIALPPDYFFYMSALRFHAFLAWSVARVLPMVRRADLVHAIKDYPHCYVGLVAAQLAGKPCVMTAHGTYAVVPLTDRRHAERARAAYPKFGRILCVSEYTKKRIEELLPLQNLEVIRNAVDASHYAPRPRLERRPWSGVPYTLGMGALKERKGHHIAVDAFLQIAQRFPDLHHFIVGAYQPEDSYFRRIAARVEAAGYAGRVRFLGNVTEEEKIDLLSGAQAFVHTPVTAADGGFEGFGIVYLEAAACGVPAIAARGSGAEDAVLDGETGFLCDPTADAAAASLGRLLADEPLRSRMGARAREHARAQTWEQNARRVLAVYEELTRRA